MRSLFFFVATLLSAAPGRAEEAVGAEPGGPVAASSGAKPSIAGPDGEDARPELVLWHAYRAREQETLERFIVELNAREQRFRVRVLAVPFDAYLDKLNAAIPRGRGPDVFIAAHDTIGDMAEAKIIAPVDDLLDPATISELHDGLVPAVLYKGHAWAVPLAFKSLALWRNTKLVPEAPQTLAELETIAKANTHDGVYGLVYENRILYFHAPFLFGFGGQLFDDSGKVTLDKRENIESVRYAMKLGRELAVVPQEVSGALALSLFNDNKAALLITGPWSRGEIDDSVDDKGQRKLSFATSSLPLSPTGKRLTPFLSVEGAFVSGKTDQAALARELTKILASEECAKARLLQGLQPVAQKAAWKLLEDGSDNASFLNGFLAQLQDTIPTPNTPAMKSVWSPVDMALGAALGQGADPAVTLHEAQQKVQGLITTIEQGVQRDTGHSFTVFVGVVITLLLVLVGVSVVRAGPKKLARQILSSKTAYLYAAPAMVGMALLVFLPFALGVGMGFFEHTWGSYTFVGLSNFKKILLGGDSTFFTTLFMTILWTAVNVSLHAAIGVFLALILSQAKLRFRAVYRVLFIIPWAVPNYITALIWKGMFHPELGAINQALGLQGFSWFNSTWSAFAANVITNTWLGFPFMMVIALGGLTSIPSDLYEAAALDGAGAWKRFSSITLPLLMPTLAPAIVLGTVWTFNMFNIIYLVSGGAPNGSTDILITEAYRWAFERGQGGAFGYAAAYSTLVFLLLVGYTTAANRVAAKVAEVRT